MSNPKTNSAGFSIVELAIALMVVGILAGAALKGAEVIRNSRLSSTYIETQTIASALKNFADKYHALPGDMKNATTRLIGCDNIPVNSCQNGNGDNQIGDIDNAEDPEYTLFWYHLTASKMLQAVNLDAPITPRAFGRTQAEAPAGGGFSILTQSGEWEDTLNANVDGLYLFWVGNPDGNTLYTADSFVVSPHDALFLDTKFDDGKPVSGNIRARGSNSDSAGSLNDAPDECRNLTVYAEGTDTGCYMYFKIREARGL